MCVGVGDFPGYSQSDNMVFDPLSLEAWGLSATWYSFSEELSSVGTALSNSFAADIVKAQISSYFFSLGCKATCFVSGRVITFLQKHFVSIVSITALSTGIILLIQHQKVKAAKANEITFKKIVVKIAIFIKDCILFFPVTVPCMVYKKLYNLITT